MKDVVLIYSFGAWELELVRQSLRNEMELTKDATRKRALSELRNAMSDAMLDQALSKVKVRLVKE